MVWWLTAVPRFQSALNPPRFVCYAVCCAWWLMLVVSRARVTNSSAVVIIHSKPTYYDWMNVKAHLLAHHQSSALLSVINSRAPYSFHMVDLLGALHAVCVFNRMKREKCCGSLWSVASGCNIETEQRVCWTSRKCMSGMSHNSAAFHVGVERRGKWAWDHGNRTRPNKQQH